MGRMRERTGGKKKGAEKKKTEKNGVCFAQIYCYNVTIFENFLRSRVYTRCFIYIASQTLER